MPSGRAAASSSTYLDGNDGAHDAQTMSNLERVLRAHPGRWSRPTVAAARAEQLTLTAAEWVPFLDELEELFARVLPADF